MGRAQLVGRRAEIGALAEAIEDARAGEGGLVLLVGEPGIGKSRLVEEAARMAGEIPVAWGRAWEAGGAPPYWPWIQVLRTFGAAAAQQLAATGGGEDRFLLFDAAARDLFATLGDKPAIAILEDLHAADEASLHFLAFLATQLRTTSLLVIGTYRDVEARMTPAANAVLEKVARVARVIAPRRLEPMDVVELAASLGLDAETVAALHTQSEGNPLFVTELLRVIARRGAMSGPLPVPTGVRSAIREHLRGVPGQLVAVLEAAAVVGREQAASIVAELCNLPIASALDALRSAVDLGVLVDRGDGRFAFSHGLIAETLHHDLPAERRMQLHVAVAAALEKAHAGDPSAPLAEIAHHLLEARDERAGDLARRAAGQARKQLAFEPAAALLERALAIVPPANAPLRYELLRMLGEVRMLADDIPRGKDACREAAEIARTLDSPELLARAALTYGGGLMFGVTDQVLVHLVEESLAVLPEGDSPLRARLMARLAGALQPAIDPRPPMQLARDAIAMANRIGDDRTRFEVIHAASSGLVLFAPPDERRGYSEIVRALATRFDEPIVAMRAEFRLIFDHFELGDFAGVAKHMREHEAFVERLRLPKSRWPVAMLHAMHALALGNWDVYAAHLARAKQLAAEIGDPFFEPNALLGHRLVAVRVLGDDEVIRSDRRELEAFATINLGMTYHSIYAMLLARIGALDEAVGYLSRDRIEAVLMHRVPGLGVWTADTLWRLGLAEYAPILYDWLANDSRIPALQMHGFALDVPCAHAAMQLAALMGNLANARKHFDDAFTLLNRAGLRPLLAWLHLDWATIVADHDRDVARRALAVAREHSVGMKIDGRLDALATRLAAPVAPKPVTKAPVDLVRLRCDGEYWTVDGLGASCKVKASRGVEMLAKLVGEPNREVHVLDLASEGDGVADAGDAGEALDVDAIKAYKKRVVELRDALEQAEQWNDTVRAERARDELEAIEGELVRASGLGGKTRRVGRAAERARINVQRRLADAIKRITDVAPSIGEHLATAVKTGVYCSYLPERANRPGAR